MFKEQIDMVKHTLQAKQRREKMSKQRIVHRVKETRVDCISVL